MSCRKLRYYRADTDKVGQKANDAPDSCHDKECNDAPEQKLARLFFGNATLREEVTYDAEKKQQERDRYHEWYQGIVDEIKNSPC